MLGQIQSFISKKKAAALIKESSQFFTPAKLFGKQIDGYRTAENMYFRKNDPIVEKLLFEIAEITDYPIENQENPQIIRYFEGGEYKPHYDFFHPEADYYEKRMSEGGQRLKTCLIYLNDDFEGGGTLFCEQDLVVKPKTGNLLIWDNINPDNSVNFGSMHAGLPVIKGVKYIFVVWIREKVWKLPQ